jgi:hypothetical protein
VISCYSIASFIPSAVLSLSNKPSYSKRASLSIIVLTYFISSILYSSFLLYKLFSILDEFKRGVVVFCEWGQFLINHQWLVSCYWMHHLFYWFYVVNYYEDQRLYMTNKVVHYKFRRKIKIHTHDEYILMGMAIPLIKLFEEKRFGVIYLLTHHLVLIWHQKLVLLFKRNGFLYHHLLINCSNFLKSVVKGYFNQRRDLILMNLLCDELSKLYKLNFSNYYFIVMYQMTQDPLMFFWLSL